MTDVKTHYITKVVNVMKSHQRKFLCLFRTCNEFTTEENPFKR